MRRGVAEVVGAVACVAFVSLLAGCGAPTTPDTEGQTLLEAREALADAGVPEENITVTGASGDPGSLTVCDQDPDGVAPTEPVTLEVAASCPEEDDGSDRKRKRKRR